MFINFGGDFNESKVTFYQGEEREKVLLEEIYLSLQTIQNRKLHYKNEDWANDRLTDSLNEKRFFVADQSRHGRSGSDKKKGYKSGEVDLVIKDSKKRGSVIAMIEALELKSVGQKNKSVHYHINKLINRYDTSGNKENFIIVYSRAKWFQELWNNYKNFVDEHFDYFISKITEKEVDKSDIKVGMNHYKRNGKELTLYHLFVNMYSE